MSHDLESFKRAIAEEKAYQERLRNSKPRTPRLELGVWKELAGDELEILLASRENAEEYLRHSSWKLRLVSIWIIRTVWNADEHLTKICEKLAFNDPHPQVREVALSTLACCFRGTNDRRIGTLLARIVHDASLPGGFRESAYHGLFVLRGLSGRDVPMPGTYAFPEDVDWSFVDSFLREDGPANQDEANLNM